MSPEVVQVLGIAVLTVAASIVGIVAGFGLSTVMIPILTFFLPVPQTLLLVGIIHWIGDVWKMSLFRRGLKLQPVLGFVIPAVIMSFIGAALTLSLDPTLLSRALGALMVAYALFLFWKPKFVLPRKTAPMIVGGAASGFLTGAFGIAGGALRGAFLAAYNFPKETYIATAGAIAIFVDSTRLITYVAGGTFLPATLLWGFLLFIPASFIGASIGKRIVNRIPQKKFRKVIAVFLVLIGLRLVIFG